MRITIIASLFLWLFGIVTATSCIDRAYGAFSPYGAKLDESLHVESLCKATNLCCTKEDVDKLYKDFSHGLDTVLSERRNAIQTFHGNLHDLSYCHSNDYDHQQYTYGCYARVNRGIDMFLDATFAQVKDFWLQLGLATICASCSAEGGVASLTYVGSKLPYDFDFEYNAESVERRLAALYGAAEVALQAAQAHIDSAGANRRVVADINSMMSRYCHMQNAWYYHDDDFPYAKHHDTCPTWLRAHTTTACYEYAASLLLAAGDWLPGHAHETVASTLHYRGVDTPHYADFIHYVIARGANLSASIYSPSMASLANNFRRSYAYDPRYEQETSHNAAALADGLTAFMGQWGASVRKQSTFNMRCVSNYNNGDKISPWCLDWKIVNPSTESNNSHMNSKLVTEATHGAVANPDDQVAPNLDRISAGAIAGIIFGVFAAIVIVVVALCVVSHKKNARREKYTPVTDHYNPIDVPQGMPPSMGAQNTYNEPQVPQYYGIAQDAAPVVTAETSNFMPPY